MIAYRRRTPGTGGAPDQIALVVLNFSDASRSITLPAPAPGVYRELLDRLNRPGGQELERTATGVGSPLTIDVPANYGQVFVTPAPGL